MTPSLRRSVAIKARHNQKRVRQHAEDDLQEAVCELLDIYVAQRKLRYFAVPNGGKRGVLEAMRLKAQGVKPGVPDLVVLIPSMVPLEGIRGATSQPRTIFLELKAGKNTLTDAQQDWANWLSDAKFTWAEIRSVQEVHDLLRGFLNGCRKIETEAA